MIFCSSINASIPWQKLAISGYSPLMTKYDHLSPHGHGLGAYIRDGFHRGRHNEDIDLGYVSLRVTLIHSITFVFTLYLPWDEGSTIFDRIFERINSILTEFPSNKYHISNDFNVYQKFLIVHSNKNSEESRYCRDFCIAYELTQIVEERTLVPDAMRQQAKLLAIFLKSCPHKCSVKVLATIGTSDYQIIYSSVSRLSPN